MRRPGAISTILWPWWSQIRNGR